jgi:hypothetical protein
MTMLAAILTDFLCKFHFNSSQTFSSDQQKNRPQKNDEEQRQRCIILLANEKMQAKADTGFQLRRYRVPLRGLRGHPRPAEFRHFCAFNYLLFEAS